MDMPSKYAGSDINRAKSMIWFGLGMVLVLIGVVLAFIGGLREGLSLLGTMLGMVLLMRSVSKELETKIQRHGHARDIDSMRFG